MSMMIFTFMLGWHLSIMTQIASEIKTWFKAKQTIILFIDRIFSLQNDIKTGNSFIFIKQKGTLLIKEFCFIHTSILNSQNL